MNPRKSPLPDLEEALSKECEIHILIPFRLSMFAKCGEGSDELNSNEF